jgi:asparagine synthetase B (glutamine-hydrolysing)
VDAGLYLPDDLLVKVDIASMAHSLEARSPFLDHEFMEFAATIPFELKVRGRVKKYILKRALAGLLPDQILYRPKMGFGVPINHWLRHELRDMAYDTLLSTRAAVTSGRMSSDGCWTSLCNGRRAGTISSGRSSCWSCGTAPTSTGMAMFFATTPCRVQQPPCDEVRQWRGI